MRFILLALLALAVPHAAHAQFKSYFDISALTVASLKEPEWARKHEGDRIRYMCLDFTRCALPTAVEIKGVVRAESLPDAFENGALSPAKLKAAGDAKASPNAKFLSAEPIAVAGRKGVAMEGSAEVNGTIFYITRWIGEGNRMLEVKVTARDLKLARELAAAATQELVPQVFK